MKSLAQTQSGYLYAIGSALALSTMGPIGKLTMDAGADPLTVVTWRAPLSQHYWSWYGCREMSQKHLCQCTRPAMARAAWLRWNFSEHGIQNDALA